MEGAADWIDVGAVDELPPGARRRVALGDAEVALFNVGGRLCAVEDACPHRGGLLSEGDLLGFELHCPLHAWPFDLRSGRCMQVSHARVRVFAVRIEGQRILVAREGRFVDE